MDSDDSSGYRYDTDAISNRAGVMIGIILIQIPVVVGILPQ